MKPSLVNLPLCWAKLVKVTPFSLFSLTPPCVISPRFLLVSQQSNAHHRTAAVTLPRKLLEIQLFSRTRDLQLLGTLWVRSTTPGCGLPLINRPPSLKQWFSNSSGHQNQLEITTQISGFHLKGSESVGLGMGNQKCIFLNKFPDAAPDYGPHFGNHCSNSSQILSSSVFKTFL